MRRLGRGAFARRRAEQIVVKACRYIRNEGREAVRRGEVKAVARMIGSIRVVTGLDSRVRDRLIEEIYDQVLRTCRGEIEGALLVPLNAKHPFGPHAPR